MSYPMADSFTSHERLRRNGRHETPKRPLIRASDIRELMGPVERLISDYPAAALATAFLTGVVVAWLVKRK
jgi:hypothetical protein